jgi:TANFOR domain-containing protein
MKKHFFSPRRSASLPGEFLVAIKRLAITMLLLCLLQTTMGQVDIKVSILPPYPSKVTDYASRPQQVVIIIRSMNNLAQDIQLRGSITGDNGVVLSVDPRYRSPAPIHLNGGQSLNLNASDISQLFDYNTLIYSGISKQTVILGNGLPEGNYQVCVQAYNYVNGQPLSSGQPLGCSNSFPVTSVEPPVIITPFDDQPVSALTTQNFPISWTTPAGAPPSTQYTVSMVEMLDNRNPNDAILSSTTPMFFQQTVTGSNLLLYGPAMPALTPGRRYALMVGAKDPFNSVTFRNNGRSAVTSFIYGDTTGTAANGAGGATTGTGPGNSNMPSATLKGKLTWYYRKSEESAPTAATKFTPPSDKFTLTMVNEVNNAMIVGAAMKDPSFVAAAKPALQILTNHGGPQMGSNGGGGTSRQSLITLTSLKSVAPTAPIVPSTNQQIGKQMPYAANVIAGGYTSVFNSNDPAYFSKFGNESHPMASTMIKLLATDSAQPSSAPQLVGSGMTDDQGNFQLSYIPPAAFGSGKSYKYSLSVQDNYFMMPDLYFSIPAGATSYDVGEVKALANTFRLLAFADDTAKAELPMAVIAVYRRADFYTTNPALKTEGNIDENNRLTETIDGQQYIKVSSINDAYTGTRLFYSDGNADEYKVKVIAQDYSTYTGSLAVSTINKRPTTPQTIQEVYQLQPGPTTFSGTVSQTIGNTVKQSIPGAIVTLYLSDTAYQNAWPAHRKPIILGTAVNGAVAKSYGMTAAGSVELTGVMKNSNIALANGRTSAGSAGNAAQGGKQGGGQGGSQLAIRVVTPGDLVNSMVQLFRSQMTATTDSSGAFVMSNVPINPNRMHYVISVPGSDVVDSGTILLSTPGSSQKVDEVFNFIAYAVTGRVVDEHQNPIPKAQYFWVSGGSPNTTDANGYFATTDRAGTDTLVIHQLGYQDKRIAVYIPGPLVSPTATIATNGSGVPLKVIPYKATMVSGAAAAYMGALQNTDTYKSSVSKGQAISPAGFGFNSTKAGSDAKLLSSWASSIMNQKDNPSGAIDLKDIVLKKNTGRMLITVLDAKGNPISNAGIQIVDTDSTEYTGSNGARYIEGPAGDLQLDISGPQSAEYAPQQIAITVNNRDTAKKTIYLAQGVKLSGHVTAGSKAVSGANIRVDGLDYLHASSGSDGSYSLIVSKDSSYTFIAGESGYVSSDPKTQSFTADATMDFTLGTASFNITKLLGFPVQIDKITAGTGNQQILSGSFVNLPGNTVFAPRSGAVIPFSGLVVNIVNNIPVPVNGSVTSDITELPLKAFNFLPVKLTNTGGSALVVRGTSNAGDAGQLEGLAAIDYASFMPSGIASYIDASAKEYLQTASSATPQTMAVLTSNAALTATSLFVAGTGNPSFNLYGFAVTLDLAHSSLRSDGLHLAGSISMSNIPLLNNTTFQIQDLWVGNNGYISGVKVNMSPAPGFSIAGWGATLTGLSFSNSTFSISGNVKVQIPGSAASEVDFANLTLSTDQLYGGSFTIPSSGIDVFGVVKFLGGPTPLSFGRLGSSNVYYIGGSGTVQFPSLFGNMTLQFFQIQTNGQFAASVPTNINEDFLGLADVSITNIAFHTNNGVGVDVQGNFLFKAIPWIKANVGGVHFGTGGSVSVDDIGLSFDMVGIAKVSVDLKFLNQPDKKGFSGNGSVTIAGLPGADISFSYFTVPNGILVSAFFRANVIIPVGAIVSINNPGGGFSLNTGDGSWSFTITGDASITGMGQLVSIKNITVTVSNGPVIKGTAALDVLTVELATAAVVLDIPKSLFTININAGINILPKIVCAQGSAIFVLSAAKGDTYFMIGAQYSASLLGIFNENANITAGWGLNVANHPEYNEYTGFIDPIFLDNGVLKGIDLQAKSDINFRATGDIYIASGSIWYSNNALVKINMGIGSGNYGLDIAAAWDCGGSLSVAGLGSIASLDIGSDAAVHMDYMNGCFSVGGELAAHLTASIGNCDDDCFTGLCMHYEVVPEGGKICAHPGLKVGYDCNSGFSLSVDL